jgi:hypothetical protein
MMWPPPIARLGRNTCTTPECEGGAGDGRGRSPKTLVWPPARAQDRLRAAECPQDIRWALLGHEEKTVAEDYGKGFSVPQLKRWIDKIAF